MEFNLKHKLLVWASNHNLKWLISFHNYVRGLLKNQMKDLEVHQEIVWKGVENGVEI